MVILELVYPVQAVVVRRVHGLPLPSMHLPCEPLRMPVHLRRQQGPDMLEPAQGRLLRQLTMSMNVSCQQFINI